MSETKKKKPSERPHPFLRDGEQLDPNQPPKDIRKMFHRKVLHDSMIQEMIEALEDDLSGMVEGAGVHAALLDFKKLKFLCSGIVNAYYNEREDSLQHYMDTLAGVLNVRFRNVSDGAPEKDQG
jgi:hypothetical protein